VLSPSSTGAGFSAFVAGAAFTEPVVPAGIDSSSYRWGELE
jgi:hypothetical protein